MKQPIKKSVMRLRLVEEVTPGEIIELTPEWLKTKYDEMNHSLFNDSLGECKLGIFTTGRGMNGGTLGWFMLDSYGLKFKRSTRRLFKYDSWGDEIWVNKDNFVAMCNPTIKLNGNYKWTEKAALSTLVHEMCHYYCTMNGWEPKQAHGTEFKQIAAYVSNKSNGIFTVQRLASAEQMNEMELNDDTTDRLRRRFQKVIVLFAFMKDNTIRMTNCISDELLNYVLNSYKRDDRVRAVATSTDPALKDYLIKHGYGKIMTSFRYWEVSNKELANNLDNYKLQPVYVPSDEINSYRTQPAVASAAPTQPTVNPNIIPHFRIMLSTGQPFELRNVTLEQLKEKLRERFPKWSEEVIERTANNPNYRK